MTTLNDLLELKLLDTSQKFVEVSCQFQCSEKCRKTYMARYNICIKSAKKRGVVCCIYCSRHKSKKYFVDENWFEIIDTPEKAWVLGWIASDGHIDKDNKNWAIKIQIDDIKILETIRDFISLKNPKPVIAIGNPIKSKIGKIKQSCKIRINESKMAIDLKKQLGIPLEIGAKDFIVRFPHHLQTDELKWHFLRGYMEGDGNLSLAVKSQLCVEIASSSEPMKIGIQSFFGKRTDGELQIRRIRWTGRNALEFLDKIYMNSDSMRLLRKHTIYIDWKRRIDDEEYFVDRKKMGDKLYAKEYKIKDPNGIIHW